MATSPLWSSYFESSSLFWAQLEFAHEEASRLGRLRRSSAEGFWLSSEGPLPVGVMFFSSFPFMGVMLFPNFVLGNASGESGAFLVPLSPFSPHLSLSPLSSPSPSFSHSLFLSFSFPLPFFSFSFSLPFSFAFFFFLFFLEGTACTVYFRDVRDDTADCNQLYLHWNKEKFSFMAHEFMYSDVNNFLIHSLDELFVFLLPRCPPLLLIHEDIKQSNQQTLIRI